MSTRKVLTMAFPIFSLSWGNLMRVLTSFGASATRPMALAFVTLVCGANAPSLAQSSGPARQTGQQPIIVSASAAVGDHMSMIDVQELYRPFQVHLERQLKRPVEIRPLRSSLVDSGLQARTYPALLVHTHDAVKAQDAGHYRIVAFSKEDSGNTLKFLGKNGEKSVRVEDLAQRRVVVTGSITNAYSERLIQSKLGIEKLASYRFMRDPDAIVYFLEQGFADIGITRSPGLAKTWQAKGGLVLWESSKFPVYALIVQTAAPAGLADRLRKAAIEFSPDVKNSFSEKTKITGFEFHGPAVDQQLAQFR